MDLLHRPKQHVVMGPDRYTLRPLLASPTLECASCLRIILTPTVTATVPEPGYARRRSFWSCGCYHTLRRRCGCLHRCCLRSLCHLRGLSRRRLHRHRRRRCCRRRRLSHLRAFLLLRSGRRWRQRREGEGGAISLCIGETCPRPCAVTTLQRVSLGRLLRGTQAPCGPCHIRGTPNATRCAASWRGLALSRR